VSVTAINEVVRSAALSIWKGILDYEDEPIVSTDILRTNYSSTFDSLATMVLGEGVSKTLAWYDNGFGYANRVVDLIRHFASMDREAA
jgi:glyceraldehyde 3-phosphate dehydrogenase